MSVGKRIYLKRELPDPEIVNQFKAIPASNTADVMGRSCAMNPRIRLASKPKAQMMAGPAYTVKGRAGAGPNLSGTRKKSPRGTMAALCRRINAARSDRPLPARSASIIWRFRQDGCWPLSLPDGC